MLKQEDPDELYPEIESIIMPDPESVAFDKIAAYAERLGCTLSKSPGGHSFFNGKHLMVDDVNLRSIWQSTTFADLVFSQDFLMNLQNEMNIQMNFFREQVCHLSLILNIDIDVNHWNS